jgi:hypothetical protein
MSGHYACQVRGTACGSNENTEATLFCGFCPFSSFLRGAMGREYAGFVGNAEISEGAGGPLHDVPVRRATHDNAD